MMKWGMMKNILLSLNIKEAYCTRTAENYSTATVPNINGFVAVNVIMSFEPLIIVLLC